MIHLLAPPLSIQSCQWITDGLLEQSISLNHLLSVPILYQNQETVFWIEPSFQSFKLATFPTVKLHFERSIFMVNSTDLVFKGFDLFYRLIFLLPFTLVSQVV
jgi:hypothetical protein